MAELPDFKRGQIVSARMAGASETKTVELFGVVRSTLSRVMTAFEKEEKTSSIWKKAKAVWYGLLHGLLGRIARI